MKFLKKAFVWFCKEKPHSVIQIIIGAFLMHLAEKGGLNWFEQVGAWAAFIYVVISGVLLVAAYKDNQDGDDEDEEDDWWKPDSPKSGKKQPY